MAVFTSSQLFHLWQKGHKTYVSFCQNFSVLENNITYISIRSLWYGIVWNWTCWMLIHLHFIHCKEKISKSLQLSKWLLTVLLSVRPTVSRTVKKPVTFFYTHYLNWRLKMVAYKLVCRCRSLKVSIVTSTGC